MDFRKIFDTIPEEFDRWRPCYCDEVFADIIEASRLGPGRTALEIGPGTGQATEPILKTGCSYLAVELGEHLAEFTRNKFRSYENFDLVNADFETCELGRERFDLVYSAATIQWIPEQTAFSKSFELLKRGGILAMMMLHTDYKSPNPALFDEIQKVYDRYFHPENKYTCKLEYGNAVNYGFTDFQRREYPSARHFTAEEFAAYTHTHCDHLTLPEPDRTHFFDGIRNAVARAGGQIELRDTTVLYLAKKP